jgi:hypothetical protein
MRAAARRKLNGPLLATMAIAGGACAHPSPRTPAPAAHDSVASRDTLAPPREPAAPALVRAPRAAIRMSFVGDINLGTATLGDGVPPDDGRGLLDAARPYLVGDLVVGNFEGVLADTGESTKCVGRTLCYAFRTPTRLAARLRDAGVTHVNLANNHANDYGIEARDSTVALLASLGVRSYGPLGRIAVDTVRRGDSATVVGLVGFSTYPFAYDLLDVERSRAVIDSLRPLVDVLVVTFHGGAEGQAAVRLAGGPEYLGTEPRGDLRRWTHVVVDAGADLVIGHGPHVLRGIEYYRGRPIVYSLGNFLTYRGFSLRGPLGVTGVLQVALGPDGIPGSLRLVPMVQEPLSGPRPDGRATAVHLVRTLSAYDFGASAARVTDGGEIGPP